MLFPFPDLQKIPFFPDLLLTAIRWIPPCLWYNSVLPE